MKPTKDPLTQLSTKVSTSALASFKTEAKKFPTQGDFFTHLLYIYKNPPAASGSKEVIVEKEVIKEVEKEVIKEVLPENLQEFVKKFPSPEEAITALLENFRNPKVETKEVEKEVIKEVEKIVEKEVIREVPHPLTQHQVIFTFLPEVQTQARKVRPFMLHDRILTKKTPHDQIDEFLNHAAKYFIRHKYDHIVNPL
jgi:hypothetical protein